MMWNRYNGFYGKSRIILGDKGFITESMLTETGITLIFIKEILGDSALGKKGELDIKYEKRFFIVCCCACL